MAFDSDVVIVGGGPAGLTAGLHLARSGARATILEQEMFGGNLQHTDIVDNYPGFPDGITGAQLAANMIEHATRAGVALEQAQVSGIELFSGSRWVACSDGRGFSCGVVILAGGTHAKRIGLAEEERFRGRGVVDCTPCDGGFFVDRDVVIYGSTDHAVRDALYLAGLGSRVTLLVAEPELDGGDVWQARLRSTASIKVRHGARLDAILGSDRVEAVRAVLDGGEQEQLAAQGVLVRIGAEPSTACLDDVVDLDEGRRILTNAQLETSADFVLACGDIRSGSRASVAAAVGEGAVAAARADELLASVR